MCAWVRTFACVCVCVCLFVLEREFVCDFEKAKWNFCLLLLLLLSDKRMMTKAKMVKSTTEMANTRIFRTPYLFAFVLGDRRLLESIFIGIAVKFNSKWIKKSVSMSAKVANVHASFSGLLLLLLLFFLLLSVFFKYRFSYDQEYFVAFGECVFSNANYSVWVWHSLLDNREQWHTNSELLFLLFCFFFLFSLGQSSSKWIKLKEFEMIWP